MSTSGAGLWTAWGTVGAAVAAAAGLFVAMRINSKDRKAAAELAEADRAALRDDERRRQVVANLLELGSQYGIHIAGLNTSTNADPARQRMRLLLHAIPGECAYTIKHMQNFTVPADRDAAGAKLRRLGLKTSVSGGQLYDVDEVYREIADDIDRYSQQPAETSAD
jgi:hypothetical protein